ncbi:MAG: tRNA pseudouridine(38-40) synthase TruA [Candidatus Margulisiibacteriota bacterium]
MQNFKAKVAYLGSGFAGFGIQNDVVTVQGELEKAIKRVSGKGVRVTPAGRTDAGVQAAGQVINFKLKTNLSPQKLVSALNANLPPEIRILNCQKVGAKFSARYSARSRTYVYNLLTGDYVPLYLRHLVWHLRHPLDIAAMRRAARSLLGRHDFFAFSKGNAAEKSFVRGVQRVSIGTQSVPVFIGVKAVIPRVLKVKLISITFKANAYAHGMVRGIVGTLVKVGQKKLSNEQFRQILNDRDRARAGPSAPAQGLCLVKVDY